MDFATLPYPLALLVFAVIGYFQSTIFTAVSRTRNEDDVGRHRKWSYLSHSTFMIMQIMILGTLLPSLIHGDFIKVAITVLVYTVANAEGSCAMMSRMVKQRYAKAKKAAEG
jgi:undecaprenyl pyrophosphate phosphatase UppP